MPFWQDCIGCSGDCVEQKAVLNVAVWAGYVLNTYSTPPEASLGSYSFGFIDSAWPDGIDPPRIGDALKVVGKPTLWYSPELNGSGCGFFGPRGCGSLGTFYDATYTHVPGSEGVVPSNPSSEVGGVLWMSSDVSGPLPPSSGWLVQAGATNSVYHVIDDGNYDPAFVNLADGIPIDAAALLADVFGSDGSEGDGMFFVMLQNQRTNDIYGVFGCSTGCYCY